MDKPFRTHDELICIMNARGLKTDNRTKFILEREGYYAVVNGYKDLFSIQMLNNPPKAKIAIKMMLSSLSYTLYLSWIDIYETYFFAT